MFDIYNENERTVVCIANDERKMCVNSYTAPLLTVGEKYTVESVDVFGWYTLVTLKEFPNEQFNSVYFSEIYE